MRYQTTRKQISGMGAFLIMSIVLSGLFVSPAPLLAATAIRSGDTVTMAEGQVVPGDFYVGGNTVTLSGTVEGDLYVAGRSVMVNGPIANDAVAVGALVSFHGPVSDDVRVVGGQITIAEPVAGDVVVVGGTLTILSSATIEGDVLFLGGKAVIEGAVNGSVHARAREVAVNSSVKGDVVVTADEQVVLGQHAHIGGNVVYKGTRELVREPNSVVVGEVTATVNAPREEDDSMLKGVPVFELFISIFAALLAVLFFRSRINGLIQSHSKTVLRDAVVGLGFLVLTPVVVALLVVSALGILVGGVVFLGYLLFLLVSLVVSGIVCGAIITKVVAGEYKVTWLWTLCGVVVLHGVFLVPVVGPVAFFLAVIVTLGALVSAAYTAVR